VALILIDSRKWVAMGRRRARSRRCELTQRACERGLETRQGSTRMLGDEAERKRRNQDLQIKAEKGPSVDF
jgi:hypothetical protein